MDKIKSALARLRPYKAALLSSAAALMIILLLTDPAAYLQSALDSLTLFALSAAPALFPFFFFSGLITRLGGAEKAGALFKKPAKLLYNAPAAGGYVWCMSVLSGYPTGAKLTGELCAGGAISKAAARGICAFTSTSGPLFIVGTVATAMFSAPEAGWILLAVHFAAALINGFFYRSKNGEEAGQAVKPLKMRPSAALTQSMSAALASLLTVGGYMVAAGMAADALVNTGAIPALARLLAPLWGGEELAQGVLIGLIEVTKGANSIARAGADIYSALPALSFILAFGGLSVIAQSLSFLSPCGMGAGRLLRIKLTQSLAALVLALILTVAINVFS